MSYYTQRHGMRTPINKTYIIDYNMYELLMDCCNGYKLNIAWKYPEECPDGYGCCGLNEHKLNADLIYEIPTLFRNDSNQISVPTIYHNIFSTKEEKDEYDQYALLDYIEFIAQNCKDVQKHDFHSYFGHYHLSFSDGNTAFKQYKNEINKVFEKTGLLYRLTDERIIERIVENSPLTHTIETSVTQIKEKGLKELLEEAIALYKSPYPGDSKDAVEKIWDALERLKSYYTQFDKKNSINKIVNDMADNQPDYISVLNDEFIVLTKIGNNYRIRHHETDKVEITDVRYYDYFFNRCLSLIALAIQYLK